MPLPPVPSPDPLSAPLRLTLLVHAHDHPIRGVLIGPGDDGEHPFEGWMELTGLIETARGGAAGRAPRRDR